ncbi:hepatocyte growth factor-regulated tyrosine kinase substrate [Chelonus insularis]|uniref:hepatocyte growth factor-regulated tyrosine kinase substrate n=1 Tax=Chelonus insularis TaxID=460826 RepID=UPI00158B9A58|nr:hepatocyte growth factor-regulated tyrosine kinase substrate [Chelonus insularis]XP_034936196.1 hepatocyte growth factor-regulated tyrosine kinase substrate [Chelonus insularis]
MFQKSPNFYTLLDKATSHLLLDPDWPIILQICDLIRQGDIQPKAALAAIKKKITNPNPHVALFGLLVLESCVKNCGSLIHDEIGTKQYMEQLKELVKTTTHDDVKVKVLGLIQAWAFAFRNSPKYTAVKDTMNIMKAEGYMFPELKESDAMFSADTAPPWADGEVCHRCRVIFNMMQRKHHCRNCGQVFCGQCSSKTSILPKFGFEKEVRVCDACYAQLNKPSTASTKETDLPVEYLNSTLSQQQQVPPRKTEEELREEEELQLALALSQSEAEQKEKEKKRVTNSYKTNFTSISRTTYSPPPSPGPSPSKIQEEEVTDPELAKYLNRQFWEQRQIANEENAGGSRPDVTSPSAPNISSPMPQRVVVAKQQNGDIDNHLDEFVSNLRSQVEIFVNRMKSNSSRGRSIINDSFFQGLFMNITTMHSRLLKYIQEHDDTRVYYEGLQDKLSQVKDARAALDALREEHREKLRREAEEAERQKQMQMAMKLDIMRKKKQEYLNYQRQLALQKIQERERELQMRQEQQKQQYIMGGYQQVPSFMGPSQGSPIRHVHYQPPGTTYNPISPTNQGVYGPSPYGPAPMGSYPMQSYPPMPSMPPHMMSNVSMNQDQPQTAPESIIQNRENLAPPPQTGMMPQMGNVPSMTQIPGAGGHQMPHPGQHPPPATHVPTRIGPQPSEIPQGVPPPTVNPQMAPNQPPIHGPSGPPAHMGMPQVPVGVQMPQSVQQMSQHVSVANNIPSQVPGSIQMAPGGAPPPSGAPLQQKQLPIQVTQPIQYQQPAPAAVQSTKIDSLGSNGEKKEDTAELISFD